MDRYTSDVNQLKMPIFEDVKIFWHFSIDVLVMCRYANKDALHWRLHAKMGIKAYHIDDLFEPSLEVLDEKRRF